MGPGSLQTAHFLHPIQPLVQLTVAVPQRVPVLLQRVPVPPPMPGARQVAAQPQREGAHPLGVAALGAASWACPLGHQS